MGAERRGVQCQRLAFVEMKLLSMSSEIIGSDWSSYSEVACLGSQLSMEKCSNACTGGKSLYKGLPGVVTATQHNDGRLRQGPPPAGSGGQCHDAFRLESCYAWVEWSLSTGVGRFPEWFKGVGECPTFEQVQFHFYKRRETSWGRQAQCRRPCSHPCHTAVVGESCYNAVTWAMKEGIHQHRDWYPGLVEGSTFEEFQSFYFRTAGDRGQSFANCTLPCGARQRTARKGERCYEAVTFAMQTGVNRNPEWYPGLSNRSSFEEFQGLFYRGGLALKIDWPRNFSECGPPCSERCRQPVQGEECYAAVQYAKQGGILQHPSFFLELNGSTSKTKIQALYFKRGHTFGCGPPCLPNPEEASLRRRRRRRSRRRRPS